MESAPVTALPPAEEVDAIFAKDTWTHEDCRRLYELLFMMHDAESKFVEAIGDMRAETPEPAGVAAVKMGIAQWMLGDFTAALDTLGRGTDNRDRRWYQGLCSRQLGQYDRAIEEFTRAGDRGWDAAEAKIAAAECQCLAGDLDAAGKAAGKLAKHADRSAYHVLRGLVCQSRGEYDEAEEAFGEALELDPQNSTAAFRLAFLYDMKGDEDQAVELYEQCLRTPPVNAHAMINLAVLHEDAGNWEQARRILDAVLMINPNHDRAKLFLRDVLSSRTMYYDEEQERRDTLRNAVLDIPVTDFELSVRARNCLKKMNIHALGDLLLVTEADLLGSKNFGETSLGEIKTMLSQKGLQLGQDVEPVPSMTMQALHRDETAMVGNEGVLATGIADLELSVRCRRALERLGVSTLGEVASRTEAELLACKNFGQTSLNEIKQRLSEYGLSIRGES